MVLHSLFLLQGLKNGGDPFADSRCKVADALVSCWIKGKWLAPNEPQISEPTASSTVSLEGELLGIKSPLRTQAHHRERSTNTLDPISTAAFASLGASPAFAMPKAGKEAALGERNSLLVEALQTACTPCWWSTPEGDSSGKQETSSLLGAM